MALNFDLLQFFLKVDRHVERGLEPVNAHLVTDLLLGRETAVGNARDQRRILASRHIHVQLLFVLFNRLLLPISQIIQRVCADVDAGGNNLDTNRFRRIQLHGSMEVGLAEARADIEERKLVRLHLIVS